MGLAKVNLGTFRCHLSPEFVNTQRCFNFMTLAITLRLRILSLTVNFNYCDFWEGESNLWTQICGKIPLPLVPWPRLSQLQDL